MLGHNNVQGICQQSLSGSWDEVGAVQDDKDHFKLSRTNTLVKASGQCPTFTMPRLPYALHKLSLYLTHQHGFSQSVKDYFELTRLHKFPLGNILVIWPCGVCLSNRDAAPIQTLMNSIP